MRVSDDGRGFVLDPSGRPFRPWGFNYDHDRHDRLLEDYWDREWDKVESDFREMKQLGANLVRVHLQLNKFMEGADRPNDYALGKLAALVQLAERRRLHLDITGLGCYHKRDVPGWYDLLSEPERWAVQARFWQAVARVCKHSPAVFCYDLMNEPVAPPMFGKAPEWLGPPFAGKHFVQWIALEGAGRARPEIARAWIRRLAEAIRLEDARSLITVGLVPWSLDRPGLTSGFVPAEIAAELDFISVHLYPEAGKTAEAQETLKGFAVGKPLLVEETFPLHGPIEEFARFIRESREGAAGWLGFYWGKTPEECRASTEITDVLMLRWLEFFQEEPRAQARPPGPPEFNNKLGWPRPAPPVSAAPSLSR